MKQLKKMFTKISFDPNVIKCKLIKSNQNKIAFFLKVKIVVNDKNKLKDQELDNT